MKNHTTLKSKFNSAFSLIELLVVIAVIAVIAAIAIPNIVGTREAAEAAGEEYGDAVIERMVAQARAMGAPSADITLLQGGTAITVNGITLDPNAAD
jgi:type IV pilus assembly protein PilA